MKRTLLLYSLAALLVVFGLGFLIGWYIRSQNSQQANLVSIRTNPSEYPLISPLLLVGIGNHDPYPEYQPLKNILNTYVTNAESAKDATDISVYFRDLNSGRWTGVNENDLYSPASMLKVAVLIACLKQADVDPSFLDKKFFMTPQS